VELGGRGWLHYHLAEVHGHLAKLGKKGRPHHRLTKVHSHLANLGERGCLHCRLAKPSERGRTVVWQNSMEEGNRIVV